jgi:starch phosphorylase
MAYLAIRGSGAVNGVSRLNGEVSRRLFQPLFPRWPQEEIPVGHVTNGVHMPTWDSAAADDLWTDTCGKDRWLAKTQLIDKGIHTVPDATLWQFRTTACKCLVEYARERASRELASSGATPESVDRAKHVLNPDALTLGFARRFATYKRPNLLLHDPARLLRILNNPERPAQLIIAGKAHPDDQAGRELIHEWIDFIRRPEGGAPVVFLSDYDMLLTERLVQGVDVWINTPRRPWEASGTSGMKVLVNGGINLSELDGWWAEAYKPEVGWALGDGREHGDDPAWDAAEADELYRLLESEVIPEFYSRDEWGIPTAWVKRMRESMAQLTPRFSADRTVHEYVEGYYLPAAAAYLGRAADKGAVGKRLVEWQHDLKEKWGGLRFGAVQIEARGDQNVFEVEVLLNGLDPDAVGVELYADGIQGGAPVRQEMTCDHPLAGVADGYIYRAEVPAARPQTDYTPRLIPHFEGCAVPLELERVLWPK